MTNRIERHCEERSNPETYRALDCFVPRNDGHVDAVRHSVCGFRHYKERSYPEINRASGLLCRLAITTSRRLFGKPPKEIRKISKIFVFGNFV
ncbi:MAG: hypothetical protein LBT42_09085 [Tannerella sp.]|nr:hypothetical protein [Tannerella sp.]